MKINKKKGFTLVELIAVIAILAILAAVVVPKISSYTESARLSTKKADASTILNAIQVYNVQAEFGTQIPLNDANLALDSLSTSRPGGSSAFGYDSSSSVSNAVDDLKNIVDRVINKNGPGTATGLGNGKSLGYSTKVSNLENLINATN